MLHIAVLFMSCQQNSNVFQKQIAVRTQLAADKLPQRTPSLHNAHYIKRQKQHY